MVIARFTTLRVLLVALGLVLGGCTANVADPGVPVGGVDEGDRSAENKGDSNSSDLVGSDGASLEAAQGRGDAESFSGDSGQPNGDNRGRSNNGTGGGGGFEPGNDTGSNQGGSSSAQGGGSESGGQCSQSGLSLVSSERGFGLVEGAEFSEKKLPLSFRVKISRSPIDAQGNPLFARGTVSCAAVGYNVSHSFGYVECGDEKTCNQENAKPKSGPVKYVDLPKVAVAKHCMAGLPDLAEIKDERLRAKASNIAAYRIHSLSFEFRDGDKKKVETIEFDEAGFSTFADGGAKSPWVIRDSIVDVVRLDDPCSAEATENQACFTMSDRFVLATEEEHRAQRFGEKWQGDLVSLAQTESEVARLQKAVLKKSPNGFHKLFDLAQARDMPELDFLAKAKSIDEVYNTLDRIMPAIHLLSLVDKKSSARRYHTVVRPPLVRDGDPTKQGWRSVLKVYGQPGEEGRPFRIYAFGLDNKFGFTKGSSGTMMMIEWMLVRKPVFSVQQARNVSGVLSTLGGGPVCTGADLGCCDKF